MTDEEIVKLKQIIWDKFMELDGPNSTMNPHYTTRLQDWQKLLEDREIKYQGSNMNITTWIASEIRIGDPAGGTLRLTEEQAKKILVLGL